MKKDMQENIIPLVGIIALFLILIWKILSNKFLNTKYETCFWITGALIFLAIIIDAIFALKYFKKRWPKTK